ncbi:ORF107 [Agrotis segetum granulovirus]|uniref:Lef-9 n=4 Tax=Betabaculovirus TaxID=558017 RepID=Q6QXG7_GVAS|nr:lef-9 [Agrotis segetum granulovirus]AAS82631.1 ORF107 [Agrotis segetum granulovirus]AHN92157.1 lef-9 [Agrotis segetum granulovirus]AKN63395.1 lef-9 [Agrotis segetum granulovirus]
MEERVKFAKRDRTSITILRDINALQNCIMMTSEKFGKFVRDLLSDLKHNKCAYYNSVVGQLITSHQDCNETSSYTNVLAKVLLANNVIITDIEESVFLRKLYINKYTDDIDYLILPNFTLWDHNFLVFMNKKFNSKKSGGLVNIWGCMQKIPLTQGVIKDLIQNKNGYAGQYLYSTFLNTSSFYANVQCFNGINEVIPPLPSILRYYGRRVPSVKVWNTRHPNISQLSTQFSRVIEEKNGVNWNIKVGLGTFVGANRDCDGDKEVITYLPYPNSLIELESLLYCDPKYSFLCFDKNKLSFVSQQIYYLYKNINVVEKEIAKFPLAWHIWNHHKTLKFSKRFDSFFTDVTLLLSSNFSTLLFKRLCSIIEQEEMICESKDLENLDGCFDDIVNSGAKGSYNLISSTKQYKNTQKEDIKQVAERAINGLNSHITSHGRVKFSGGDIYHNTVVFLNLYLKNNKICYKQDGLCIGDVSHIPSDFLFPTHLLDMFIRDKEF